MVYGVMKRLLKCIIFIVMPGAGMPAWGQAHDSVTGGTAAVDIVYPDTLKGVTLQEVVVKRSREHYSKRNNPAVEFAKRLRAGGGVSDPKRNDNYSFRKYERISVGLNDFKLPDSSDKDDGGKFGFIREHVDTSDVTGLPVLPLSVKEKVVDVVYRRNPHSEKQYVLGLRQHGVDEIADLQNVQTILEEVFREIDLYDDDIILMRNRFVSPLSAIAPDFYKFYLTDTVKVDDIDCIELSFAPRNPSSFGFIGRIYVEACDSTMFVKKVRMGVPPAINLNFVDRIQITQTFKKAPDGSRLKVEDDLNVEMSIVKGTQGVYARRSTAYDSHSFAPVMHPEIFDVAADVITSPEAARRSDGFWNRERLIDASDNERRIPQLMHRLRGVPLYRYGEKVLKWIVVGYVQTGKESKFDIGPLNTFISYNSVEGVRLRGGGITTANLNKHWFGRGYVAYGTRDRKFKYNAELEYSFIEKRNHSREFPVHSIALSGRYDIDQLGQNYQFTNADNVFLALKRGKNHLITYRRHGSLAYKLELANNLSFDVSATWERQQPGPFLPFRLTNGSLLSYYDETFFKFTLRYAPGEKFYQTKSSRVPISKDAPVFILTHTYAPQKFLGSRYEVNKTEISAQKRVWLSAFGYLDLMVKGGHVWGRSPYISLLTPNVNLSYTIQRESFALLNPMEFINDSFVSWETTYWANGALLNNIPLVKRLKLREVVSFRGWYGALSAKNDPSKEHPSASGQLPLLIFPDKNSRGNMHEPYMEISAGIDNIFRCIRLDYVWRLTYKDVPGIDRSGLRVAFHVTF